MVAQADIINRALQVIGTRTTVSAGELIAQSSNEAIQALLVYDSSRDQLSRMAPWNHCFTATRLVLLTAAPGTPENLSPPGYNGQWNPAWPIPPWQYMYQYPVDCLRALYLIPQPYVAAGTGTPVPIFPVPTGLTREHHRHRPKFKVGCNKYATGDFGPDFNADFAHGAPTPSGRVLYTNEGQAVLAYVAQVVNPDAMDPLFQQAWTYVLASQLAIALTGDKTLANGLIQRANVMIDNARAIDGDEEILVIDHDPDWMRVRGFGSAPGHLGGFDWGDRWPSV